MKGSLPRASAQNGASGGAATLSPLPSKQALFAFGGIIFLASLWGWTFGRPFLGPDGQFGFWSGDIWSSSCSQRVADPYSFSHIIHGFVFYYLLWLVAGNLSLGKRFLIAGLVETAWELLENSSIVINRYREGTAAIGYTGDSLLNSASDIAMMGIGFLLAARIPVWLSVALILLMEIGCAFWIRDNLTLNVIMLLSPNPAVRDWQMGGG